MFISGEYQVILQLASFVGHARGGGKVAQCLLEQGYIMTANTAVYQDSPPPRPFGKQGLVPMTYMYGCLTVSSHMFWTMLANRSTWEICICKNCKKENHESAVMSCTPLQWSPKQNSHIARGYKPSPTPQGMLLSQHRNDYV